jgi:hypothetical protein
LREDSAEALPLGVVVGDRVLEKIRTVATQGTEDTPLKG